MKVIDLLNKIANGEELPEKVKYCGEVYDYINIYKEGIRYTNLEREQNDEYRMLIFSANKLNDEVEILDDEEDKYIPLIPDDELWEIDGKKGIIEDAHTYSEISRDNAINRNFKVLKEKINQVVEEFNEYRKENEENEKQKEKKQRNGI